MRDGALAGLEGCGRVPEPGLEASTGGRVVFFVDPASVD